MATKERFETAVDRLVRFIELNPQYGHLTRANVEVYENHFEIVDNDGRCLRQCNF